MSRFVIIERHRDLLLAELAKIKLESEGIYCYLGSKYHIATDWRYSQALGGVKLYVRTGDEERAKKILTTDESRYLDDIDDYFPMPEMDDICQRCGSLNISYINRARFFGMLSMLLNLPLYIFGIRYKCRDCGYKMKPIKTE